jgi:hypothetical protein
MCYALCPMHHADFQLPHSDFQFSILCPLLTVVCILTPDTFQSLKRLNIASGTPRITRMIGDQNHGR